MATSEETLNQFLDHLKDDHITTRKMMGNILYIMIRQSLAVCMTIVY